MTKARKHSSISATFRATELATQVEWRKGRKLPLAPGRENKGYYAHVLPAKLWELGLWPGISSANALSSELDLPAYLAAKHIQRHTGAHNLLSSWVLCANLYFPFRTSAGHSILAGFLAQAISQDILDVTGVELEYAADGDLGPRRLLGEDSGSRGSGQTSPDVAFLVRTTRGSGIVLTESKYTEHNFYVCSGYKKKDPKGRTPNPDPLRCRDLASVLDAPQKQCHVEQDWKRRYWEHLGPTIDRSRALAEFTRCPASNGAYQLFRQQALTQGIANQSAFGYVASAVAYHEGNKSLFHIHGREGTVDLRDAWSRVFRGTASFTAFTHQSWVAWVRDHDWDGTWRDWLDYIADRYRM